MKAKTGTIQNLAKVNKYLNTRGFLGIVWGDTAHDPKRSSSRRMAVLLLRGKVRSEYQFGIDWYYSSLHGFENEQLDIAPISYVRSIPETGLFHCSSLCERYFGKSRRSLSNYLPELPLSFSRLRVLPNRQPDDRGLVRVRPREVGTVKKLALEHRVDGLSFDSKSDLNHHLTEHVRFFSRVKGTARTNEGPVRFNHWNIGPIRP